MQGSCCRFAFQPQSCSADLPRWCDATREQEEEAIMNGSGVRTKAAQVSTWSRQDVFNPHFDMCMHQPCHACTPCLHTHTLFCTDQLHLHAVFAASPRLCEFTEVCCLGLPDWMLLVMVRRTMRWRGGPGWRHQGARAPPPAGDHAGGPPCRQHIGNRGCCSGKRDTLTVFDSPAGPEQWLTCIMQFIQMLFP